MYSVNSVIEHVLYLTDNDVDIHKNINVLICADCQGCVLSETCNDMSYTLVDLVDTTLRTMSLKR